MKAHTHKRQERLGHVLVRKFGTHVCRFSMDGWRLDEIGCFWYANESHYTIANLKSVLCISLMYALGFLNISLYMLQIIGALIIIY